VGNAPFKSWNTDKGLLEFDYDLRDSKIVSAKGRALSSEIRTHFAVWLGKSESRFDGCRTSKKFTSRVKKRSQ